MELFLFIIIFFFFYAMASELGDDFRKRINYSCWTDKGGKKGRGNLDFYHLAMGVFGLSSTTTTIIIALYLLIHFTFTFPNYYFFLVLILFLPFFLYFSFFVLLLVRDLTWTIVLFFNHRLQKRAPFNSPLFISAVLFSSQVQEIISYTDILHIYPDFTKITL